MKCTQKQSAINKLLKNQTQKDVIVQREWSIYVFFVFTSKVFAFTKCVVFPLPESFSLSELLNWWLLKIFGLFDTKYLCSCTSEVQHYNNVTTEFPRHNAIFDFSAILRVLHRLRRTRCILKGPGTFSIKMGLEVFYNVFKVFLGVLSWLSTGTKYCLSFWQTTVSCATGTDSTHWLVLYLNLKRYF